MIITECSKRLFVLNILENRLNNVLLFRCDWFDNTPRGTCCPKLCPFIEVNGTRRYRKYDPFIFATSATQVDCMRYPDRIRDTSNWWVVLNKPRHNVNNELILPIAFPKEYVSHMTPVNDTTLTTLLNKEEDIEEVNEDGTNEGSDEEEWEDDYDDTDDEIDVHLEESKDDNETEDDD